MAPSLLLLLLCCLWPVDCRIPPPLPTRKPHNTKTMRLSKADEGPKHSVIDLSDDINNEPDSSGEFTMASLSKPDMPRDFTVCSAFMVKAWTTDFSAADLFQLNDVDGDYWASVQLFAAETYTELTVQLGEVYFLATIALSVSCSPSPGPVCVCPWTPGQAKWGLWSMGWWSRRRYIRKLWRRMREDRQI